MNRAVEIKTLVEEILTDINEAEHRNRLVPHGFTLISADADMAPSFFPENSEHGEVRIQLEVPVIYSVQNNRAALPASRDNLNQLRAWIEKELRDRGTRLELSRWDVSPDRDPEPKAKREDPDVMWIVDALICEL